jgi:glycine cleavage system transcriptional repressor
VRTNIVLTLTGTDRIGLVHDITELLLGVGGNVETSRMARLGGEFAVLMLVSLPAEQVGQLGEQFGELRAEGYVVTVTESRPGPAVRPQVRQTYRIQVEGADHEGIIHDIAHHLSQRGINIESLDTGTRPAPVSGTPLFSMTALVDVPPSLEAEDWQSGLEEAGQRLNVEVNVEEVQP